MIFEKKLIIGISIISCLIESYDDSSKDSATYDIDVIEYGKNEYNCNISNEDFEVIVDLLNKTCTRKDFINKHVFAPPFVFDRIISTECRKEYLEDIYNQLVNELDKVSDLFETVK